MNRISLFPNFGAERW